MDILLLIYAKKYNFNLTLRFSAGMPTIEEVCSTFGLTDVELEYSESDFQNLTSYKLFQQHVRPLLAKENPKVCFANNYRFGCSHVLPAGPDVEADDAGGREMARVFRN